MAKASTISRFFNTLGSAISVAGAVENHRAPKARDLRALGINPVEFSRIGRNY